MIETIAAFAGMFACVLGQVGFRYVLGDPLVWSDEQTRRFSFDAISRVEAWKRDDFTVDTIGVSLHLECDPAIHVGEAEPGYESLLQAIELHIAGFPNRASWWGEVAFPPFQELVVVIWSRPGA